MKPKNPSASEIASQVESRAKKWSPELRAQLGLNNPYEKAKNIREGHLFAAWNEGYAAGLRDGIPKGEARLARALRRWLNNQIGGNFMTHVLFDWLTARQKSRRKEANPLEKLYKTKKFKAEWEKLK